MIELIELKELLKELKLEKMTETDIFSIAMTILVAFIIVKMIGIAFGKMLKNKNQIHIKFLRSCIQGVVVIYCVYKIGMTAEPLNAFTSTIVKSSSLLVVVAGFAAQEALGNIINGLFISVFKPFDIGDKVKLASNNLSGYIEDITIRHTVIKTFSNSRVIVPNSIMNKEIIENSHYKDIVSGNQLDIMIGYESDIETAMTIIKDIVNSHPDVRDIRTDEEKEAGKEQTEVFVRELMTHGVQLRVTVWTDDIDTNFKVCSDIRLMVKKAFDENNISIPYDHLHLVGDIGVCK